MWNLTKKAFSCILIQIACTAFADPGIKVGIVIGPQVQVMEVAKSVAKQKYNLNIKTVVFADYQSPNETLNAGDIDANIFQTNAFLKQAVEKRDYQISVIGNTFIYPMGIYSKKIKKLTDLGNKVTVAIPNDPSNQARALVLLKQAGLIEIKAAKEDLPTPRDVLMKKYKVDIKSLDAAQVARSAQDLDLIVLNNDFVTNAGFKPHEALFHEDPNHATPYINVIVARNKDKNKKELKQLVEIMHSKEVIQKTEEVNPGAIKAW